MGWECSTYRKEVHVIFLVRQSEGTISLEKHRRTYIWEDNIKIEIMMERCILIWSTAGTNVGLL
jgi:hypothetical protein